MKKSFDSVEANVIIQARLHLYVDSGCIDVLSAVDNGGTASLKLHQNSCKVEINIYVQQGDTISPKMFTTCLARSVPTAKFGKYRNKCRCRMTKPPLISR